MTNLWSLYYCANKNYDNDQRVGSSNNTNIKILLIKRNEIVHRGTINNLFILRSVIIDTRTSVDDH
jgi:hypothetical protein